MKSYILKAGSGKIAAALCKFCAEGEIGEFLLRDGMNQAAFCLFTAKLTHSRFVREKPLSIEQVADILSLVSGGNASAAQKALATCSIKWEVVNKDGESILDDKGEPTWEKNDQSVEGYWDKAGTSKSSVNLSLLDA